MANTRHETSHFVMGVSYSIEEECHVEMLHDNMDISSQMVYDKQVEETRLTNKHTDAKRARSNNGGSFKGKHQIQDKPTFKKRFSNQVS